MINSKAIEFRNLDGTKDILSNLIKNSAREMIACAVEEELQDFLARHAAILNTEGNSELLEMVIYQNAKLQQV